ncbi:hypothetical protein IWW55_005369 [Coemansia sp. RSA 2706]|nr:hypothetical protein IWW55_005369 [Coemansia sp. RSA 2706]KAJ2308374.1 hypothetical protein IWW52_005901 [Coemansia sp. RSA 2704]KAJ2315535.1 hypothetical protein IWW54_000225 [Coemansia sp. RSA 2705]KAJ2319875.1 hypothetical protein IWW51_004762 [Coemansia sp. RSA 2702]KAJ2361409.1 hypothetical protein H4S01_005279 [Coemansia sp. RSA 2610]KAJ2377046.1 hypothetical protein H4S02_007759 [Coemansia sp. RSA 2611]KAJ2714228.1 hypothetical protein H4R23_005815 [Coemansia sp. Cherry 401B]
MKIDRILARLESGPAAARLLPNVQSLVLTLSQRTRAPGARHFWRTHLRQLQFANPDLPISVNYPREACEPSLEIRFSDAAPASFALANLHSDDICRRLLAKAAPKQS